MPHSGYSALHGVNPNEKKKKGRHEVDFLYADKQTILQVDTINVGEYG